MEVIGRHGYLYVVGYDYWKGEMNCPICGRPYDATMDEHHLRPKCKKGSETVTLHRVCHDKIHATFSEKELAKQYNTIEKLLEHEEIARFANRDEAFDEILIISSVSFCFSRNCGWIVSAAFSKSSQKKWASSADQVFSI